MDADRQFFQVHVLCGRQSQQEVLSRDHHPLQHGRDPVPRPWFARPHLHHVGPRSGVLLGRRHHVLHRQLPAPEADRQDEQNGHRRRLPHAPDRVLPRNRDPLHRLM